MHLCNIILKQLQYEKNEIFSNITYIENDLKNLDFYFKIGNLTEKNIINKLIFVNNKSMLPDKNIKTKFNVWLNMRMCFWNKSFTYLHQSNEYKVFNFENEKQSIIFSALLNSNIFLCIRNIKHETRLRLKFKGR